MGSEKRHPSAARGVELVEHALEAMRVPASIERFDEIKCGIFQRKSANFRGLVLSVSRPMFAIKYSFVSIPRDLQDLRTFAPLQIQL